MYAGPGVKLIIEFICVISKIRRPILGRRASMRPPLATVYTLCTSSTGAQVYKRYVKGKFEYENTFTMGNLNDACEPCGKYFDGHQVVDKLGPDTLFELG
ncbi:hypothetical protein Y032_0166g68 [Ancylostoma ceylanicum]|nr:hypothetical protein Y032_0166g68 [Ancylostoma ceylanicum]